MKNKIKFFVYISIFALLMINYSCLTEEEREVRTPEMEQAEIDNFITELTKQGYDFDTTQLGVYYSIDTMGLGPLIEAGDTISVEYLGTFINGTVFDSSADHWQNGIWEFVYLEQSLIAGFNDVLSIMNKGAIIDAVIPSFLGYGAYGYDQIPPYTPLLFSVKVHDIKKE